MSHICEAEKHSGSNRHYKYASRDRYDYKYAEQEDVSNYGELKLDPG